MSYARLVLLAAPMFLATMVSGQSMNASLLLQELQKLNTVGTVLYVAAHPDDENTALLTYLAQEEKLETAYLSLTRGGGGQNLIGPELKEYLGLIRANELLQARKIDGAKQLFTRARDFGYSKNPEDTLENWQEDVVLGDVVYAVRFFRPDIIITRFNPDSGPTHGHHTVSAQLALQAFRLAADPRAFPEQLDHLEPHQATRIFWNGYGRRGRGSLSNETREMVSLEIGNYNPLLGTSYTEIAARSRSMHKSQGFGRAGQRGQQTERLVLLDGETAEGNFLSGIDTSWARFAAEKTVDRAAASKVSSLLAEAVARFENEQPWKIVRPLIEADRVLATWPATRKIEAKRSSIHHLIAAAMGLHFEVRCNDSFLTPNSQVSLEVELINRSPVSTKAIGLRAQLFDSEHWPNDTRLEEKTGLNRNLRADVEELFELSFQLPDSAPITQPFWLKEEPEAAIYHFKNRRLLELMNVPAPMSVTAQLEVEGHTIELNTPAIQRLSDPVKGEVHHLVSIRPEAVLKPDAPVLLFESEQPKHVDVFITGHTAEISGTLAADVPSGWEVTIADPSISLNSRNPTQVISAAIIPPAKASEGEVQFRLKGDNGKVYEMSSSLIDYEHIGRQPILSRATTKVIRLDLARAGNRIACIEGVGDTVPATLEGIGYEVDRIQVEEIEKARLQDYDTVILGPRAFDALVGLDRKFQELNAYVEAGGTLISQYNTTSSRAKSQFTSPYPLRISRDRVSEEQVEMRILKPEHRVFNTPNKIDVSDFENWIQERGLYYANSWDDRFEAVLSANDRGEPPRDGGLLIAQYGKGWYAYTGLSFFRQLPEGNPGAIRLFVNLISLGHGK